MRKKLAFSLSKVASLAVTVVFIGLISEAQNDKLYIFHKE